MVLFKYIRIKCITTSHKLIVVTLQCARELTSLKVPGVMIIWTIANPGIQRILDRAISQPIMFACQG